MQLSVTLPVNSIGAACYGRLAQYTPSLLDRHAGSAKTEKPAARAATAFDADLNVGCEQAGGEGIGCELCALVGVEVLGPSHV